MNKISDILSTNSILGEQNAAGGKVVKDRITFMPCCNISGSNKLPLMVVGKSKKPRCFKNAQLPPIHYRGSRNAWMDRSLFGEWFYECFIPAVRQFSSKKGIAPKALLLMDNCSAHHCRDKLVSEDGLIEAIFLPPNVTSIAQPLDQGVIQNIKLLYRRKLELYTLTSGN